ncbi:MAG: PfkB family carbohydrate kinase [bacterium]
MGGPGAERPVRVLCHGLVASDFLVPTAFPVPRDRKVRVRDVIRQGGGPAANASVALARLGARVAFAGAVGDDALGREQIEQLAREGVNVDHVEVIAGTTSFVSFILVEETTGARTIFSAPDGRPLASERADSLSSAPDLVLVDGWGGPAQLDVARQARERGIPLLLDAGSARPEVMTLAALADVVIASEPFAEDRAGPGAAEDAVRQLLATGATLAAVTRGPRTVIAGARGAESLFEVPAVPVRAVDTTGAGDAFHGGAAFGLASGAAWEEALRLAAYVAARKCEKAGAREGLPFLDEVRAQGWLDTLSGDF